MSVLEEIAENDAVKGDCWASFGEGNGMSCTTWVDTPLGRMPISTPATHPTGLCEKHAKELLLS